MKGKKERRGRQKKRWEDNIKEWTVMDFVVLTRAAKIGGQGGKFFFFANLKCPDDLPRLWDKLE